jgi:hypothetical protein
LIQSAMMFALGFFVSGLLWLAFSVALVRRARRLTERRLLAGIATRRAEFDSERDELRARHAVQMHRLEREVSRVLDQATAHRLDADLKERDLHAARAELAAREDDLADFEVRMEKQRDLVQDLERRHAEGGSALRSTQHALRLEGKRRTIAEEGLDEMSVFADQRRMALTALRLENDALRARLGEPPSEPLPIELEDARPRRSAALVPDEELEPIELPSGGSVVPLPTRARQMAAESPDKSVAVVAEAARDLQRIAGAAEAQLVSGVWRAPATAEPHLPAAAAPGNIGELVALRMVPPAPPPSGDSAQEKPDVEDGAENRFFEALAEIRALKRAANQAGE